MGGPIRVLHVVVNMNRGGAETLIMNLYRNMDRTKVQFDFLTCKEGVFDKEIQELGGRVYRIPYLTEVGHFGYVKELNQFFRNHSSYIIVHSHMDKMSGLVMRAAECAGIPVRIAHSHNTQSEGGILAKLYKNIVGRFIYSHASHFVACSNAAAQWLYGKKSNEAVVIKNGINYEQFLFSEEKRQKVRNEFNIPDDTTVIGHVGRFNYQKNHSFIIDVFAELNKSHSNSILVLVGDGTLRSKIEDKVRELHLQNKVLFLGVRPDIHLILQGFDLFIFPSLHEGLPVTLVEAQGSGLPCLVSKEITTEVDLGDDLVDFLAISHIDPWVKKIIQLIEKQEQRQCDKSSFLQKGYDIKQTAERIQNLYLMWGGSRVENFNNLYPNF